jgi:hypothetical protein
MKPETWPCHHCGGEHPIGENTCHDEPLKGIIMKYKVHPVAAMFPLLVPGSSPFNDLEVSIQTYGQIEPIVVDGDILLDGRNRLAVCEGLGIEPKVVEWSTMRLDVPRKGLMPSRPLDQDEWIFQKNVARRNITEDQRTALYAEFDAWQLAANARKEQEATQFKEGNVISSKGGLAKAGKLPVDTKSSPPAKRDVKAKAARSTAGRVASKAGVSQYKAGQAIAVVKAAGAGDVQAKENLEAVKAGLKTLNESAKKLKSKLDKPKPNLECQFKKWWPKCLDRFAASDQKQVKAWIKEQI